MTYSKRPKHKEPRTQAYTKLKNKNKKLKHGVLKV